MTHSGGKPHAVGDNGQRYEVSYFDPSANVRKIFGWSDEIASAQVMAGNVEKHPSWSYPQIRDREAEEFIKIKETP
jgi:hypothetical protein